MAPNPDDPEADLRFPSVGLLRHSMHRFGLAELHRLIHPAALVRYKRQASSRVCAPLDVPPAVR